MDPAAILIAPRGLTGALRDLIDGLGTVGVEVTVVDELATAVDACARSAALPAILLDLRDAGAGEVEDQQIAGELIKKTLARLPNALPIVVTSAADPMLIVSCVRAGAGDILDLQLEGTAVARAVVQRICERQAARRAEIAMVASQRDMIEDLLKDLIRTERRSIDAEEALAARARPSSEIATALESRQPSVLLIEHERTLANELTELLETAGVATFAYVTGEEALREVEALGGPAWLDLALVAAQLPGIDGIETVRRLRARVPGLPAFLMTSFHDGDLAERAADLGVVGFVAKPLADINDIVRRLAQLARDSLHRTREHVYLQRIKERHERVLARYRSLPREP
ncbi:MAG TPA: response regulator [Kofleriaceae bacterium]|jgi:CheY-like chemotaxis protein|nr:response regulator [Kofleriaceae bacterium]